MKRLPTVPLLVALATVSASAWAADGASAPARTVQMSNGFVGLSCAEHLRSVDAWRLANPNVGEGGDLGIEDLVRQAKATCRAGQQTESMQMVAGLRRMLGMPSNTVEARDSEIATRPDIILNSPYQ